MREGSRPQACCHNLLTLLLGPGPPSVADQANWALGLPVRTKADLMMLDRIMAGVGTIQPDTYEHILVLPTSMVMDTPRP